MMTSPFGKNKAEKSTDCYAQEKCSMTSLRRYDLTKIFTGISQLDEIDFQRMSSPTSSTYSDARTSLSTFSCRNGCFGDTSEHFYETSPKSEKDIRVLSESIIRQIYAKQNFTSSKIIHVDIAPENECGTNGDISSHKDIEQTHEIHASENLHRKVSAGKKNYEGVLKDDSNKEFQETRAKVVFTPKTNRCEDIYDSERRVRWSPEAPKLCHLRKSLDKGSSIESLNQSGLKEEHIPSFNRRQSFSPNISPRMRRVDRSYSSNKTFRVKRDSSAQTDNASEKSEKESKFKTTLVKFFLSFVKCFM